MTNVEQTSKLVQIDAIDAADPAPVHGEPEATAAETQTAAIQTDEDVGGTAI